MRPHVIKFVSADKLSAYQLWSGMDRPQPVIDRIGMRRLNFNPVNPDEIPTAPNAVRRRYELYDRYCDETNGNIVREYREILGDSL